MDQENLIDAIQLINNKFSDSDWSRRQNGEVLSYTAMKLAAMKAYLLDVKEIAQAEMLDAEIDMETAKGQAFLKLKEEHGSTAAADAKNTDPDYIKAKREYAGKKVYFDKLRSVTTDTHDLIESIRSRIIDLQSSRKDESIR